MASVEAMFTTRPAPLACRCGSAARMSRAWAVRLTATVAAQASSKAASSAVGPGQHRHTGVVHQDVETAEVGRDLVDELVDLRRIADVADPSPGVAAGGRDLRDDGLDTVGAEIDDGDAGPLVGEQVGGGAAHAARRPCHQRDLALDGP